MENKNFTPVAMKCDSKDEFDGIEYRLIKAGIKIADGYDFDIEDRTRTIINDYFSKDKVAIVPDSWYPNALKFDPDYFLRCCGVDTDIIGVIPENTLNSDDVITFKGKAIQERCGVEVEEEEKPTNEELKSYCGCDEYCGVCDRNLKADVTVKTSTGEPLSLITANSPQLEWQPKHGEVVEVSDDENTWFNIHHTFVALHPRTKMPIVMDLDGEINVWQYCRKPQLQPDYSAGISAIQSEAEKHGVKVNVIINEVK